MKPRQAMRLARAALEVFHMDRFYYLSAVVRRTRLADVGRMRSRFFDGLSFEHREETRGLMVRFLVGGEVGLVILAMLLNPWTADVEVAARWRVSWARNVAGQHDAAASAFLLRVRYGDGR